MASEDGFILSLVKSLRSQHLAAGAVVLYEGEIAGEMYGSFVAVSISGS
jgi:hypothetical protein